MYNNICRAVLVLNHQHTNGFVMSSIAKRSVGGQERHLIGALGSCGWETRRTLTRKHEAHYMTKPLQWAVRHVCLPAYWAAVGVASLVRRAILIKMCLTFCFRSVLLACSHSFPNVLPEVACSSWGENMGTRREKVEECVPFPDKRDWRSGLCGGGLADKGGVSSGVQSAGVERSQMCRRYSEADFFCTL